MKSLIIPVVTPAGIPAEQDLPEILNTGSMTVHSAEGESWKQPMIA